MIVRLAALAFLGLAGSWAALGQDPQPSTKKSSSSRPAAKNSTSPAAKASDATTRTDAEPTKAETDAAKADANRKVDFSGFWAWSFTGPNGFVYEPTLKIQQKGSMLKGTIYGKRGGSLPVKNVRITKESNVAFSLDRDFYGFPMEVKFIGKLDGDKIVGKMGVFLNGDTKNYRVFDWVAARPRSDALPPAVIAAQNPYAPNRQNQVNAFTFGTPPAGMNPNQPNMNQNQGNYGFPANYGIPATYGTYGAPENFGFPGGFPGVGPNN
jgi:hypothetical protein